MTDFKRHVSRESEGTPVIQADFAVLDVLFDYEFLDKYIDDGGWSPAGGDLLYCQVLDALAFMYVVRIVLLVIAVEFFVMHDAEVECTVDYGIWVDYVFVKNIPHESGNLLSAFLGFPVVFQVY